MKKTLIFIIIEIISSSYLNSQIIKNDEIQILDNEFSNQLSEEENLQAGIDLLQFSNDIFSRTIANNLSSHKFTLRGLDNKHSEILMNGINLSKTKTGNANFNSWSGLNDVIKFTDEVLENGEISKYTFGNIGTTINYNLYASKIKKEIKASYSISDRNYKNRISFTYSSGLLPSNLAFSFSFSKRWTEKGRIDAIFNDSYAHFISIEKRFSKSHRINVSSFGNYSKRALKASLTQEIYDLRGKNYNPYWGFQQGNIRREKIAKNYSPIIIFSDYLKIGKIHINTSISNQFENNKFSRLANYKAQQINPIFYKNLPSYNKYFSDNKTYELILNEWMNNDFERTQINWDYLYNANFNSPELEQNGIFGKRASYYLVEDIEKNNFFNLNTHISRKISKNHTFNLNLSYQNLFSENYSIVKDLLGAKFAVNENHYINANYNILNSKVLLLKNDKIEYNYKIHQNIFSANLNSELILKDYRLNFSGLFVYNESYRKGMFKHELYSENSHGKSKIQNFIDLGGKINLIYKINKSNLLKINSSYISKSPIINEIFINPRLYNETVHGIKNQLIFSNDFSYIFTSKNIKLRFSGYYTIVDNSNQIYRHSVQGISFENEGITNTKDSYITEVLTNISKEHLGFEFGIEQKINKNFSLIGMTFIGQYIYKNNPNLKIYSDDFKSFTDYSKVYLKNYKLPQGYQSSYSFGLRYISNKNLWCNIFSTFLTNNYMNISSVQRTKNWITNPEMGNIYPKITKESLKTTLKQRKFDDIFLINFSIGKNFYRNKKNLSFYISINNILNNKKLISGYEQGRLSYLNFIENQNREYPLFGDKLQYNSGRNYSINLNIKL